MRCLWETRLYSQCPYSSYEGLTVPTAQRGQGFQYLLVSVLGSSWLGGTIDQIAFVFSRAYDMSVVAKKMRHVSDARPDTTAPVIRIRHEAQLIRTPCFFKPPPPTPA